MHILFKSYAPHTKCLISQYVPHASITRSSPFQALDSPFSFNSGNECGPLMGNLHLKGLFNVLLLLSVKDVEV